MQLKLYLRSQLEEREDGLSADKFQVEKCPSPLVPASLPLRILADNSLRKFPAKALYNLMIYHYTIFLPINT